MGVYEIWGSLCYSDGMYVLVFFELLLKVIVGWKLVIGMAKITSGFFSRTTRVACVMFTCMAVVFAGSAWAGPSRHGGRIVRAQFTTAIDQREPVDNIAYLDDSATVVYFFTEILSMTGNKVFHRWEHNGQVVSKVAFDVGGPRWRINTKKRLDPSLKGTWTVVVTDGDGWPLIAKMFIFGSDEKDSYLDEVSKRTESTEGDSENNGILNDEVVD